MLVNSKQEILHFNFLNYQIIIKRNMWVRRIFTLRQLKFARVACLDFRKEKVFTDYQYLQFSYRVTIGLTFLQHIGEKIIPIDKNSVLTSEISLPRHSIFFEFLFFVLLKIFTFLSVIYRKVCYFSSRYHESQKHILLYK